MESQKRIHKMKINYHGSEKDPKELLMTIIIFRVDSKRQNNLFMFNNKQLW